MKKMKLLSILAVVLIFTNISCSNQETIRSILNNKNLTEEQKLIKIVPFYKRNNFEVNTTNIGIRIKFNESTTTGALLNGIKFLDNYRKIQRDTKQNIISKDNGIGVLLNMIDQSSGLSNDERDIYALVYLYLLNDYPFSERIDTFNEAINGLSDERQKSIKNCINEIKEAKNAFEGLNEKYFIQCFSTYTEYNPVASWLLTLSNPSYDNMTNENNNYIIASKDYNHNQIIDFMVYSQLIDDDVKTIFYESLIKHYSSNYLIEYEYFKNIKYDLPYNFANNLSIYNVFEKSIKSLPESIWNNFFEFMRYYKTNYSEEYEKYILDQFDRYSGNYSIETVGGLNNLLTIKPLYAKPHSYMISVNPLDKYSSQPSGVNDYNFFDKLTRSVHSIFHEEDSDGDWKRTDFSLPIEFAKYLIYLEYRYIPTNDYYNGVDYKIHNMDGRLIIYNRVTGGIIKDYKISYKNNPPMITFDVINSSFPDFTRVFPNRDIIGNLP